MDFDIRSKSDSPRRAREPSRRLSIVVQDRVRPGETIEVAMPSPVWLAWLRPHRKYQATVEGVAKTAGGYRLTLQLIQPLRRERRWYVVVPPLLLILAGATLGHRAHRDMTSAAATTSATATAAASPGTARPQQARASVLGTRGPWGQLELTPIEIQPPAELNVFPPSTPRWYFAGRKRAEVLELFRNAGVTAADIKAFDRDDRWEESAAGTTLEPGLSRIIALSPEARTRIHAALSRSKTDPRPPDAVPVPLASLDTRLAQAGFDARTKQLVQAMLVRKGSWGLLWDRDALLASLSDEPTRHKVIRTLLTDETFLVRLHIDGDTDVAAVARYWQLDTSNQLRPMIESVAKLPGGDGLAFSAVLPPFARNRIYRYPDYTNSVESRADCLWSALSFMKPQPEENVGNPKEMIKTLGTSYRPIPASAIPTFGDLVVLMDANTVPVHAAVYLADDLVFTKNGTGIFRPWIVMRRQAMVDLYQTLQGPLREIVARPVSPSAP